MMVGYSILLNETKDPEGRHIGMWDGYKPDHSLIVAWIGTISTVEQDDLSICEELFEMFNINHPKGYKNRSLSVGDVVLLTHYRNISGGWKEAASVKAYKVDRVGFVEISNPAEAQIVGRS